MGQEAEIAGGIVQKVVKSRVYEDHGSAMMRFESGACAYVQSSLCRFSARAGDCDEGLIHGSKGCIKYEMDQDWYIKGFPTLNNSHAHLWKFGVPSFIVNRWMPVHVNHGRKYCLFKRQLDHFVSLVQGTLEPHPVIGTNWAATARDGMKAVKMVHEVYRRSEAAAQATD